MIFWNSQRYIYFLDMSIKAHEFENILIDLICANKCGYWACIFEIPKGIYMFLTCQSKHMNFENRMIDLICTNKCGHSVCILKKTIWWNSLRYIHILDMPFKGHEFENILIDLISRLNVVIEYAYIEILKGIYMF